MGFWVLTRYDDVAGMLRDARFGRKGFDTLLQARFGEAGVDLSMLFRDPPDHTRLRALVSKAFTPRVVEEIDRKSTRLNSSHSQISYAVFCLKKKTKY